MISSSIWIDFKVIRKIEMLCFLAALGRNLVAFLRVLFPAGLSNYLPSCVPYYIFLLVLLSLSTKHVIVTHVSGRIKLDFHYCPIPKHFVKQKLTLKHS